MQKYHGVALAMMTAVFLNPGQSTADSKKWGNDVLVHQAGRIYGFGMDQADKDTLLLVVSDSATTNFKDTLYIYRSINDGQAWNRIDSLFSAADNERFGKADIIAAKGYETYEDSDFVFVFFIKNAQLCCARYPYDFSSVGILDTISDAGENVVDFVACEILRANYYLLVAYQTGQDSVIFKRSTDRANNWSNKTNLTSITPINGHPSIAWNRGYYLVVAGKTADDRIYTIRTTVSPPSWTDGQYLSGLLDSCGHPVVVASHTTPSADAYFWLFYQRWNHTVAPPRWDLDYHYGRAGANWTSAAALGDNSRHPSLHVLKELDASNITLAYRYEIGADSGRICHIYNEDGQASPGGWPVSHTGVNDYDSDSLLPQRAYTLRGTDSTVRSTVLYVSADQGLYFDASSFVGIQEEMGYERMKESSLGQNHPNPFNSSTTIEYAIEKDGEAQIAVYNILGQKVKTLLHGHNTKGSHTVVWDGKDTDDNPVASGVYFYKMESEGRALTEKMILMK